MTRAHIKTVGLNLLVKKYPIAESSPIEGIPSSKTQEGNLP